uniref:Pre-mRNA-splicing factor ISY1 n=1 Tax=Leptocylindrus danicus TaxID=163516 RepID=A0A6U2RJG5_9STRA|mmetsp:Transcript_3765/g.5462  ORF Transcript_3765/g.5462 Transcript_3765/m.5462 type:complete len:282 (+) Transcript_3765:115-960(+)
MARPEEKAQNMMNKWVRMAKGEDERDDRQRRPYLSSLCDNLYDAERFRKDIIREVSDGIRKIQNAGMGEHAIRDLNDQINKLLREKWHWNKRIIELGGPNYNAIERAQRRAEGDTQDEVTNSIRGSGGYRYFGAAKDLPGVKELFIRHAAKLAKRNRGDIYKSITPDYYGLRDEDDGVLLEIEAVASAKKKAKLEMERTEYAKSEHAQAGAGEGVTIEDVLSWGHLSDDDDDAEDELSSAIGGITGEADAIAAHFAVPTQEIVKQTLLERRKRELMARLSA